MQPGIWLRAAGFFTWIASGIPAALAIAQGRLTGGPAVAWTGAFAVFGLAFGFICFGKARSLRFERALVVAQSVSGAVMVCTARDGLAGATLVVAASQFVEAFPPPLMVVGVAAHIVVIAARFWWLDGAVTGLTLGGGYLGFHLFAIATSTLAFRERLAREALSRVNAELHSTRALLAEDSRVAERLRISRDLHDTLGHHLTALSLQLEVASRLTSGAASEHVTEAHAITRLLLGDVRDVVSRLRDSGPVDLAAAIRTIADGATTLQVHVDVADGVTIEDPLQSHAILRCVQEVITNAMRHAHARNVWIVVAHAPGGITLKTRDDGRGVEVVTYGNGLRGMRERFEELSGRVECSSKPGAGFEVHAFVPQ